LIGTHRSLVVRTCNVAVVLLDVVAIAIHVALLFNASARCAAVDRARSEVDGERGEAAAVRLLVGWVSPSS